MKSNGTIRRKELAAAISMLLALPGIALAQDQDSEGQAADDEMIAEEVIVTGIRRGLMNSVDIKGTSTSIVEAISAEEIGKLPDVSITDSLARLPGVTAQRLNGRSQVLSVRGLGPDFTTALLNGRPQVSSGDNRGVEFDQYPSEMISQAIVYKTPNATLMGQGLAGTVDMQTIRPLEYGKQALVANARYVWNDITALNNDASDDGWRGSVTYVDQFMDDTVGVAFGFAYADTPTQSERFNAWGYPDVNGDAVIGGAKPYAQSNELERTGIIGTLEWQVSDRVRTSVDLYYTEFEETQYLRGIEFPLFWSSAALQPGYTVEDGLVVSGTFDNVKGVMRNDINNRDSELTAAGWNLEWDVAEGWVVTTDLSYSKMDRKDVLLETYSGTGPNGLPVFDSLSFDMRDGKGALFSSSLDYTDPNLVMLTSPQGWGGDIIPGGQLGYNNSPSIEDELTTLDLRALYEVGGDWLSSIEFGVNYQTRKKYKVADEWFVGLGNGDISAPLPAETGLTNLSHIGIPGMVTYDPIASISSGIFTLVRNPNADVVIKSWTVEEDLTSAFAMVNFDTDVGDVMVYGNFGLQYVRTDQSSSAASASGTGDDVALFPTSGGDDYTEWLPSMNVTFDVGNSNLIRFAYARTLARARMDQMRASLNWGFDTSKVDETDINNSPWGGSGGNPELRPWIANAFDLSYEKYLDDGIGYVAVAGFYKDLDSWVNDAPQVYDFTGFPTGGFDPVLREGLVSIPQNQGGGKIYGFEVAGALDFGYFADSLTGLGVIASASFTKSDVTVNEEEITLPGLSEDVYNLTAYYENERFSVRASARYRSEFLGEVSGFGAGREFRTVNEETVVDGQASWFFGGKLTGLSLLFQVYNLTDEAFTTFANDDTRQIIDYQRYGRTYLLGASYNW
ncbi:MAG: TonB-dependent receptor [Xanthomonadales bacterium]|nr:TonB-dependent receptor [Gammaproteobacteria bacterium]MBT8049952.1 TonB-dependent receptor [Gammaproteobacteria bacterium]MBT8055515.1 TonB-dependent receptor [Gammaproteobacteria bacterium]NNJ78374.1 TonB-dependent receptor [Xanthomonadales bacterium]NNL03667.1 TonB-dependent receptor [Xanthomonadales bacterium]